uniref:VHS domain-containing protein n=1 Tax=Strigamia maritima TaxID=126957 RepID=T1J1S5_STRMM
METMTAFFGGNPFTTLVGQKIEQATDVSLPSENWALNMEICDIINETEDGAKDAIKAMRKRLTQNAGKNYNVVMYTLTVLETCVKNCGKKFHSYATSKEFVQELVKLIGPKNDPPTAVQEKVLSLIQSWADAFKGTADMSGVVQVYQDLRQKGVEFPMTDLDAMAPIHTPIRSVPDSEIRAPKPVAHVAPPVLAVSRVESSRAPVVGRLSAGSATLTPEQLSKMRSELEIVQGNMRIFGEMLMELVPGQEHPSDLELLLDLHKTCKAMQTRVVELIDRVGNEEVTNELLRINDEMNNLFLRYSRFEGNRPRPLTDSSKVEDKPLIDWDEGLGEISSKMENLDLASANTNLSPSKKGSAADDEFDMFAQSRTASYEKTKTSGSSYDDNVRADDSNKSLSQMASARSRLQSENDFDEMEAWLKGQSENGARTASGSGSQPVSSLEFDRFLAERASAPDQVARSNGGRRQVDKDETENRMFAL